MGAIDSFELRWKRLLAAADADEHAHAILLARDLVRDAPDFDPARQMLGCKLTDMARYDEAKQALRESLKHCPSKWVHLPMQQMGHLEEARGRLSQAATWFRRAIEVNPKSANAHVFLGNILCKQGRLTEAEAAFRQGTRCSKGCAEEAHYNLGMVLCSQERYEEALSCFEQALKIDPKYRLAKRGLRDVRRAIKYLRRRAQD